MKRDLSLGASGPEVGNLQRFLNARGHRDMNDEPLVDDEGFGPRTSFALRRWQSANLFRPSGVFGGAERHVAIRQGFVPFVQAKSCTILHPQRGRHIRLIVIHTMESSERPGTAENVGTWFAGPSAPRASAHYGIDPEDVVQYVREWDVAWHAPGANHDGIGLEHAGRAAQSPEDWSDEASSAILDLSARIAARIAVRYGIAFEHLDQGALRDPKRSGFVGHVDCTNAFSGGRGHVDPGPNFPWTTYLERVKLAATQLQGQGDSG